jgi:hypothetical protein
VRTPYPTCWAICFHPVRNTIEFYAPLPESYPSIFGAVDRKPTHCTRIVQQRDEPPPVELGCLVPGSPERSNRAFLDRVLPRPRVGILDSWPRPKNQQVGMFHPDHAPLALRFSSHYISNLLLHTAVPTMPS